MEALLDMGQVEEQGDLQLLEENFAALQNEIRELNLSALQAMKKLNDKTSKTDFDVERYRDLKKKLQDRLPILETRLHKARIQSLQARIVELQKELADIQPQQLKSKAIVHEAQKLLDQAWQEHARLDLKAASLESSLKIEF